jgi:predicted YcjX-like family ATPase
MRALTLDIVDYPGEWLLDLALLTQELRGMVGGKPSRLSRAGRSRPSCRALGTRDLASLDPKAHAEEPVAQSAAKHVHRLSA